MATPPAQTSQSLFARYPEVLACPLCQGSLQVGDVRLTCAGCGKAYDTDHRIPLLFASHDPGKLGDVTDTVMAFYQENPFPNYDDIESEETLIEKARQGIFAQLLDEQIPQGAFVLDVGCGTGQLTNFLGLNYNRRVFGSDICLPSLRLAQGFRDRYNIRNAGFMQMNLFRPAFKKESFNLVISNGVLHHTADPYGAFRSISRLVKPGGFIVIGLYNKIGRLTTDFKRFLFRVTGDRLSFLDGHMRNQRYNKQRKRAWFFDQYKHPHESKHTFSEVIDWYETNDFEYLSSIPKIELGPFTTEEKLFELHDKGTRASRFFTELEMLLTGGADGALFIVIGRKLAKSEGLPTVV